MLKTKSVLRRAGSSTEVPVLVAVFDRASRNGWRLLTSRYGLGEVVKNLAKLPPSAVADWQTLSRQLIITRDVWKMDRGNPDMAYADLLLIGMEANQALGARAWSAS